MAPEFGYSLKKKEKKRKRKMCAIKVNQNKGRNVAYGKNTGFPPFVLRREGHND